MVAATTTAEPKFEIGRVIDYQRPSMVAFTWKSPDWEAPTSVEVRFIADGAGTRVEVEHGGWDQGPTMQKQSKGYDEGWIVVLGNYQSSADAAA